MEEIIISNTVILNSDSQSIQHLCKKDKRMAKVISMVGDITYEPPEDSYSFLVETILGQMLSNKVVEIITERLRTMCNDDITSEAIGNLSDDELRSIGTSNAKVTYIRNLTDAARSREIDFAEFRNMSDDEIIKTLTKVRGIGKWSAKMYLIFVLNRENVLPYEDVAFLQAYSWIYKTSDLHPKAISAKCRKWAPYSSIAARYLYRALDTGLLNSEFRLFK